MQLSLPGAIGMSGPGDHGEGCDGVGRHRKQSDLEVGDMPGQARNDLRHPIPDTEAAGLVDEIDEREQQHLRSRDGLACGEGPDMGSFQAILGELRAEPLLLVRREPAGVVGLVDEKEITRDAAEQGRYAFQQQHPAPAAQAESGGVIHDPGAQRRPEKVRHRNCGREQCHRHRLVLGTEPIGEIDDDAGEEAGFGGTEQESQHIQLQRRVHERTQCGDEAPYDQDAGDPDSGAETRQCEVARHLEQKVADEKYPGRESESAAGESQLLVHLQRRVTDVGAIYIRDDVEREDERNDAPEHFSRGPLLERAGSTFIVLVHFVIINDNHGTCQSAAAALT